LNERFRANPDGLLAGIAVLACALLFGWHAWTLPSGPAWSTVGPGVAPRMVTALLGALGLVMMAQALLRSQPAPSRDPLDRPAFGWLIAGIVLEVALIGSAGFVLASTILFACAARAFGSRRPVRDAAIGLALAATASAVFDRVLGYPIGDGLIEQFLFLPLGPLAAGPLGPLAR
jgi:putative tricarboxylic transport membrane protein